MCVRKLSLEKTKGMSISVYSVYTRQGAVLVSNGHPENLNSAWGTGQSIQKSLGSVVENNHAQTKHFFDST